MEQLNAKRDLLMISVGEKSLLPLSTSFLSLITKNRVHYFFSYNTATIILQTQHPGVLRARHLVAKRLLVINVPLWGPTNTLTGGGGGGRGGID